MDKIKVSMTTDFLKSNGLGDHELKLTAQAGFSHIHWCQHWSDDFFYTAPEIEHIQQLLVDHHLKLADTHGSHSSSGEKCWYSTNEPYRQAGVELVKNRIEFTFKLGGDSVVVHGPDTHQPASDLAAKLAALNRSLDELESYARDRNIKLALENSNSNYDKFLLPTILPRPAEFVGFCYDCGHHNQQLIDETPEQRKWRDDMRNELASRLTIVHLHDNDGFADKHWIPFTGAMDWNDVIAFLKLANFHKPLNIEVSYGNMVQVTPMSHEKFMADAYKNVYRLSKLLHSPN